MGSFFDKELALPMFIGLMISVLSLVLSLNIIIATLTFALLVAIFIFMKSFSKGWLFLLALVLLFPTLKLGTGSIFLFDLLLLLISLLGIIKLAITDKKVLKNRLTFHFFLIFLVGFSYLFFGLIFNLIVNIVVWKITLNLILIWFLLIGFQYFFQTQKRIKLFFSVLIGVATAHSMFGIIMLLGGWQTSIGMGISTGKIDHPIINQATRQINGFLGIGLENQIGNNSLAGFLVVSTIVTLGFLLLNKQQEKVLLKKKIRNNGKTKLFDGIQRVKKLKIKFKNRKLFRKRIFLFLLFLIQFIGLILTFSYSSLIFLGIGLMTMGILTRNKALITTTMVYLIALTIVLPSIYSSVKIISDNNLSQWFSGLSDTKDSWIIGNSISSEEKSVSLNQFNYGNSYLLIWNSFGIIGLIVFLKIIWRYFVDIHKKYESTKKGERIWFVIVASCFVSLLLEGLSSNVLIFGPTAIIFWLMYGIILNLGKDNINNRFKKINFN